MDELISFTSKFQEMERRGIDAWTGDIPTEFQDDRWLYLQA